MILYQICQSPMCPFVWSEYVLLICALCLRSILSNYLCGRLLHDSICNLRMISNEVLQESELVRKKCLVQTMGTGKLLPEISIIIPFVN